MIPLSSTKIMLKMYFWDCDYKTYDLVPSHGFLLNFVLAGWSVFLTDSLWFPLQIASTQSEAASLASHTIWELFRPCAKSATRTFAPLSRHYPWALPLRDFQHQIISHLPRRPHQHARRLTHLPLFLLGCMIFCLSKSAVTTVVGKACRPDQCPAGVLAGDRVLIKVFADNIPPFPASSVSL